MCIKRTARGFTLIELIVFIVIVSVGLAGVLAVFNTVTKGSADPIREKQAIAAAESLMEEVLSKYYCDPDTANTATVPVACGTNTPEASRDLYDAVEDYHTYGNGISGIRDVASAATVVLAGYNVSIGVTTPTSAFAVTGAASVPVADYRIVTVTVTDTMTNRSYALSRYAFNLD